MTLPSLIERALFGSGAIRRRNETDEELSNERANFAHQQREFDASVRQHTQIASSTSRVFHNWTHAMAMMEAGKK